MKATNTPIIQLMEQVIEKTKDKKLSKKSLDSVQSQLEEIAERLDITPRQALMMAAIVNRFDDSHIEASDLARHFDTTPIKILAYWPDMESLREKKLIRINEDKDDTSLSLPKYVLKALKTNKAIEFVDNHNLSAKEWFRRLSELLHSREDEVISASELKKELNELIGFNPQLHIVDSIMSYKLSWNELLVLLILIDLFVQNGDDHILKSDMEDMFESRWECRNQCRDLESGDHTLQQLELVEHSNANGQVESNAWKLTEKAKQLLLSEIEIKKRPSGTNLKKSTDISAKKLYYNEFVTKQVRQLEKLLEETNFHKAQDRLEKHGMRRGFTCIFYGSPGTGKTETVLQLARRTGRNIMNVDIPNLRSKWVGDTEKNIKAIFDTYRTACQEEAVTPILLFNEADAVLCKRNEGATSGVDKMENAMQNIILQEMENFDGIMIATTNLTDNLDAAFERRFLYKIEFPKPTPQESRQIWKSMLPELQEESALELAKQYNFSGGQIENIARKHIVNAILSGEETLSLETILESCHAERLNSKKNRQIGFY